MFIPLEDVFVILEKYKYVAIFPITIFEGPIVIILSGFLVNLGFLNVYIILPILLVGDLIGDSFYYAIGRYGNRFSWVKKIGSFLGYRESGERALKKHFEKHTVKTLLIAKMTHGVGAMVQVAAGMAGVSFGKYFLLQMIGTIPKTLILFFIGFYLGNSYMKINAYIDILYYAVMSVLLVGVLYIILKKYSQKAIQEEN